METPPFLFFLRVGSETDKATMELDSFFDGVLLHIAVKEGAVSDGAVWVIGTAASNVVVAYADQQLPRAAAVETTNEHTQQCRHVQYVESEAKHRQRAY